MNIPSELSSIFLREHFDNYPFVRFPQEFEDDRGVIRNIADGKLGDVAVINSNKGAIRANHIHGIDWHISYMVFGSMEYSWSDNPNGTFQKKVLVKQGKMVYTPVRVPHKMEFLEDSCIIAVSALSRMQENYEADTVRLESNFFTLKLKKV